MKSVLSNILSLNLKYKNIFAPVTLIGCFLKMVSKFKYKMISGLVIIWLPVAPQVDNWNPLTDTVPIHSWIHPWLPQMQMRLEPLYPPIRNKLANALQRWHPSDASARLILQPWKDVFTPGAWEAFMVKNIVPKLGVCLSQPANISLGLHFLPF